uniref:UTP23 small subunit processome component n=1 Tax=Nothoprocta perdicaria TaxID=30464 RepID=A0A8C6ZWI0_NOTPE
MKITRQKHAKKNMGFYKHNFHFREPFQVLLDGTFCQAALRNKIQIREQLPGYLDGATHLCTTRYGPAAYKEDFLFFSYQIVRAIVSRSLKNQLE